MQTEVTDNALAQPCAEGNFVVRQGTFFQVGDYPDKQFSLTEAEADAAIARFAPVPLNIEHIPTIFDGKLGMVRRLWREGKNLLAEYIIPRWLHEVTRGEAIKISSEWGRTTKQAQGGAFVLHPRVADAVMLAAFHNRPLNTLRDTPPGAASRGAAGNANARFAHSPGGRVGGAAFGLDAAQADLLAGEPAQNGAAATANEARQTPRRTKEGETMSLLSGIRALFQRAGVPTCEIDAQLCVVDADTPRPGRDAVEKGGSETAGANAQAAFEASGAGANAPDEAQARSAQFARFVEMEAELVRLRDEARQSRDAQNEARETHDAQAIETLVRGGQMTPAEADAWRQIARDKPAAFAVVLPALCARPRLPHVPAVTVRASQSHDADRLETLTRQRMREQGLDHAQAFRQVCGENKDLALAVRTQSQEGN